MAEEVQVRACPKDCRKCSISQQVYCTTSLAFNTYELLSKLVGKVDILEEKVNAIQGSEDDLVAPVIHDKPKRVKE